MSEDKKDKKVVYKKVVKKTTNKPASKANSVVKKVVKKETREKLTEEFNKLYALIDEAKKSQNREEALRYGALLNEVIKKLQ